MYERAAIKLTLNGRAARIEADPADSLADALRDGMDMTATHIGCNEGVCGSCTVLLDGKSARACMTLAGQVEGCRLDTVEGYERSPVRRLLQQCFVDEFAAQCGFCTSGMLAVAAEFLEDETVADHTDRALIRERLTAVLCRCTGYHDIVSAVVLAAQRVRGARQ